MRQLFLDKVQRFGWIVSVLPPLIAWQLIGMTGRYRFLPSLDEIAIAGSELLKRGLLDEAFLTLRFYAIGLIIAVILGIFIGALMGRFRAVEYSFDLYINTFMAAPVSALVPVLIVLFGLGSASIIATVFMFAFFVVVINTYTGVRETPGNLVDMARSFGATEAQIVRRVVLPNAIPLMITGLRMGVARGVNGVVLGEMLIAVVGIGGMLMFYGGAFRIPELYALIFPIVGFSLLMNAGLSRIEKRIAPWKQI